MSSTLYQNISSKLCATTSVSDKGGERVVFDIFLDDAYRLWRHQSERGRTCSACMCIGYHCLCMLASALVPAAPHRRTIVSLTPGIRRVDAAFSLLLSFLMLLWFIYCLQSSISCCLSRHAGSGKSGCHRQARCKHMIVICRHLLNYIRPATSDKVSGAGVHVVPVSPKTVPSLI